MMSIIPGIVFFILQCGAAHKQMLKSSYQMTWSQADVICSKLFNSSDGYRHLAAEIPDNDKFHADLVSMVNSDSVWLDGVRYYLGCSGQVCKYLNVRHRRFLDIEEMKIICKREKDRQPKIRSDCKWSEYYNITKASMIAYLNNLKEFVEGDELIVNKVDLSESMQFRCQIAHRITAGFELSFTECKTFHKALCEHNTLSSEIRTTVQLVQRNITATIVPYAPNGRTNDKALGMKDTKTLSLHWIIGISLSVTSLLLALVISAGCIVYCVRKRRKNKLNEVYDTAFLRPCGQNYTVRLPERSQAESAEISESLRRVPFTRSSSASNQTAVSNSTTNSYVEDIQYYRNLSYETQPSVPNGNRTGQSQLNVRNLQLHSNQSSPQSVASGRYLCPSCGRHGRKKKVPYIHLMSTSTNDSPDASGYKIPPRRLGHRNVSQDSTESSGTDVCRSCHVPFTSKQGRYGRNISVTTQESYYDPRQKRADSIENPLENPTKSRRTRRQRLVERISSSNGFTRVKRMLSIDLK